MGGRAVIALLFVAACSGGNPPPARPAPPSGPALSFVELDDLLNTPGAPRVGTGATVADYRATIRERLTHPAFYDAFVPTMLTLLDVHQSHRPFFVNDVLSKGTAGTAAYFYLERIEDCHGKDLIQVRPWWALDREVSICRTSVRADVVKANEKQYCDASAEPMPECGCGPNLVLCAPSGQLRTASADQSRQEIHRTVRQIVLDKLPYSNILTMQDSVRSTFGDWWYQRNVLFQGGTLSLPPLSTDDKSLREDVTTDYTLKPRRPEYRGGILTTPMFLLADGSRRVTVQHLFSDVLCVSWASTTIDPHVLLALSTKTADIRTASNAKLVETPGCRDCHTRLENATLALEDFPIFLYASRYQLRATPAQAKLYVNGAEDVRATFNASAYDLGTQMAAQPEFNSCAVDKVLAFTYQGYQVPDPLRARLVADFSHGQDLGKLIENALISRIFGSAAIDEAP